MSIFILFSSFIQGRTDSIHVVPSTVDIVGDVVTIRSGAMYGPAQMIVLTQRVRATEKVTAGLWNNDAMRR